MTVAPVEPLWELQKKGQQAEMVMTAVREWLGQQLGRMGMEGQKEKEAEGQLREICARVRQVEAQ